MGKILVVDNYDSFTYNLVHYLGELTDEQIDVYRNDEIPIEDVDQYDKILLSPGPGIPTESNLLMPIIEKYAPTKKIFGVCLGLQAIGEVFGGKLKNLSEVYHGVATNVSIIEDDYIYNDIPKEIEVGRYHSWVVAKEELPSCFTITSEDNNGEIMSMKHNEYDVRGVQFHPESVLTETGKKMIKNWLIG